MNQFIDTWDSLQLEQLLRDQSLAVEALGEFSRRAASREPRTVLTPLLPRITLDPSTELLKVPVDEGLVAADVAPGAEGIENDIARQTLWLAGMKKSSVTMKATREQLDADGPGILRRLSELAGAALARRREARVVEALVGHGTKVLDNASGEFKSSTGRDATGTRNGTLVIQDVIEMLKALLAQGHVADTFICNPASALAWWMQPAWREWFGEAFVWDSKDNKSRSTIIVPRGWPSAVRVCLSTFMAESDLILADSNFMGEVSVDQDIRHESWTDPERDITKNKYSEVYGVQINEQAVAVARNLQTDLAYDFGQHVIHNITGLSDSLTGDLSFSGEVS